MESSMPGYQKYVARGQQKNGAPYLVEYRGAGVDQEGGEKSWPEGPWWQQDALHADRRCLIVESLCTAVATG